LRRPSHRSSTLPYNATLPIVHACTAAYYSRYNHVSHSEFDALNRAGELTDVQERDGHLYGSVREVTTSAERSALRRAVDAQLEKARAKHLATSPPSRASFSAASSVVGSRQDIGSGAGGVAGAAAGTMSSSPRSHAHDRVAACRAHHLDEDGGGSAELVVGVGSPQQGSPRSQRSSGGQWSDQTMVPERFCAPEGTYVEQPRKRIVRPLSHKERANLLPSPSLLATEGQTLVTVLRGHVSW